MSTHPSIRNDPPLVVHLIYRFAMGGLETGLVNLINRTPADRFRHVVLCMTDYSDFCRRIQRSDVPVVALHKRPGRDFSAYWRLFRLLRRLRPDILHTRNLGTLEGQIYGFLAGVPGRIHGEHGRDMYDLYGTNRKYNLLRRVIRPFVHQYTAVSRDLAGWLVDTVGARPERVTQICNGVDAERFHPRTGPRPPCGPEGFAPEDAFVIGTVGRMQAVKDQPTLVRAFLRLWSRSPDRHRLRLVLIGEGPLREECRSLLQAASAEHAAWLPGECAGIPELLRSLDLFVLPSIGEGISNTILEAMASALPLIVTRVGGNPELVDHAQTGMLVPPSDPVAMAEAIEHYYRNPQLRLQHGRAGRARVETRYSLDAMIEGYLRLYERILNRADKFETSTAATRER